MLPFTPFFEITPDGPLWFWLVWDLCPTTGQRRAYRWDWAASEHEAHEACRAARFDYRARLWRQAVAA